MQDPVNLLETNVGLMTTTLFVFGVVVASLVYLLVRFLRAYERRSGRTSTKSSTADVVEDLEAEVAQLRTDITNLTHSQDFTTQLLAQRSAPTEIVSRNPEVEVVIRDADRVAARDSGANEAK
jgi:uncharacterized membrane protein YgaE (UPF0421/DUF939 family)